MASSEKPLPSKNLRNWLILAAVILVVALTALVKTMTVVKNTVPVEPPEQVLERLKVNGKPALVFFHSPDCRSCLQVQGSLDEVYPEFSDQVTLLSLDVLEDSNDVLVKRTGVHTTPTLLFVDANGNEQVFSGEISAEDLQQRLSTLVGGTP